MKGQTPKVFGLGVFYVVFSSVWTSQVDKAVKPKAPRGRALKRIQYNKRFFSAVAQTGGRKKGPNAQEVRKDFFCLLLNSDPFRLCRCPSARKGVIHKRLVFLHKCVFGRRR